MDDFQLLTDLHIRNHRQGPGGDDETRLALELTGIDRNSHIKVADIGCGTGASTLLLASELNAEIKAVDFIGEFLDVLKKNASEAALSGKISTIECSMENLPFKEEEFDLIWSEGAIYNMGFENGARSWKRYLKTGGYLVVSELTWTTDKRPAEVQQHWESEYPEIDTASAKFSVLEKAGYSPTAYFTLPEKCWSDHYYLPIQKNLEDFLKRNNHSDQAKAIAEGEHSEWELFRKYKGYFNYGFYIAKNLG